MEGKCEHHPGVFIDRLCADLAPHPTRLNDPDDRLPPGRSAKAISGRQLTEILAMIAKVTADGSPDKCSRLRGLAACRNYLVEEDGIPYEEVEASLAGYKTTAAARTERRRDLPFLMGLESSLCPLSSDDNDE